MTTSCTSPRNPADDAGSPPNGSGDPPSLSAESTSSGEIGIVAHDIALPRDDRGEHASLSAQFTSRDHGLSSKEADSSTDEPRTSHGLTPEYASIPTRWGVVTGGRLWLPPRRSCIPYLTQGWGLHIGLCPMAHLEVVKSKPVQVPLEHSVKVRVDLGHHEFFLKPTLFIREKRLKTDGRV